MKCVMTFLSLTLLVLAGCEYESPLAVGHGIAIDPAVLGLWEPILDEGEERKQDERMIILKYSDTEYLIHYPPGGNDELYYRGYLIKVGGVSCVQLQVIGTRDGLPDKDRKGRFHVVWYQLTGDKLEVRILNTDLVDTELKTTEALRREFLKHRDNKDLFKNPGMFKRRGK